MFSLHYIPFQKINRDDVKCFTLKRAPCSTRLLRELAISTAKSCLTRKPGRITQHGHIFQQSDYCVDSRIVIEQTFKDEFG